MTQLKSQKPVSGGDELERSGVCASCRQKNSCSNNASSEVFEFQFTQSAVLGEP